MKALLLSLTLISVAAMFCCCKHQPTFTADKLPARQIHWGTGGGVVGKETTHTLLENGQLFQRDIAGKMTEAGRKKAKIAAGIFKSVQELNLAKLEFSHPGNTYSFIEWQDGDAISRTVWGDPKYPVAPEVNALYERLNTLLKK